MSNATKKLNVRQLIGQHLPSPFGNDAATEAACEAKLIFLGTENLLCLIRYWRRVANSLAGDIRRTEQLLSVVAGKTAADIRAASHQYERPTIGRIGMRVGNFDYPEPLDRASDERRPGATTLNICGWCEYARGALRHNCRVVPQCGILADSGVVVAGEGEKRRFDSGCFLLEADDITLCRITAGLMARKQQLIAEKREVDDKIVYLLSLKAQAVLKPVLPAWRAGGYFGLNDQVVFFVSGGGRWLVSNELVDCRVDEVIDGGFLVLHCDQRVHGGEYQGGHGVSHGAGVPTIMHRWELDYLLAAPEYAAMWARCVAPGLTGYDPERLIEALAKRADHSTGVESR